MSDDVKIKYVNYGIANVIQGTIYMHSALKDNPSLHAYVLAHELRHINNPSDKNLDWVDVTPKGLTLWMFQNPSSFVQLLPIWKIGNKIIYSKFMMIFWFWILFGLVMLVGIWMI